MPDLQQPTQRGAARGVLVDSAGVLAVGGVGRALAHRLVRLRVTSAGRTALPRLLDSAARVVQCMLAGFNATEVRDLRGFLNRMIENGQSGGSE